jgi:hypothetical protein
MLEKKRINQTSNESEKPASKAGFFTPKLLEQNRYRLDDEAFNLRS